MSHAYGTEKYSVPFWFEPHTKSFRNVSRFASEATDGPSLAAASVVEFYKGFLVRKRSDERPRACYAP